MSTPENIARLREIKRLLDRIQQLPHIAAGGGNGVHSGFYADRPKPFLYPEPVYPESVYPQSVYPELPPEPEPAAEMEPAAPVAPAPPAAPVAPFVRPIAPPALPEEPRIDESRALVPVRTAGAVGINPWLFVTATALNTIIAAVLAVVITLGVARRDAAETAPARGTQEKRAESPAAVELLPVGSAAEPLRLEALKPARLPFEVRPEEAMQAGYNLVLSGLPANATLSGATRMGTDTWHVAPGALGQLGIVLPEWSASPIEVDVELRHANGAVAAKSKAWLSVPPPPVPRPTKLDRAAIEDLLRRGDRLLGRGDITGARAVYEQAAARGSAQAALALASSYDPGRLWSLGVFGMVGDKERAHYWYERADELGHPDARKLLEALQSIGGQSARDAPRD